MLLIDIGNTRLKWATKDHNGMVVRGAFEYCSESLTNMLDMELLTTPHQSVWISSVVMPVNKIIQQWFEKKWDIKPFFAESQKTFLGLTNAYVQPKLLGIDRWLAMLAAFNSYAQSICVIDCGTAVTFDVIDKNGSHQGGLIMPGLRLMEKSLLQGADKLNDVDLPAIKNFTLATNTENAVRVGCVMLLASGLSELCVKQINSYGNEMRIVMTGGDAEVIASLMSVPCLVEADLVLQGLGLVAEHGVEK